jgi:hypothetical protein
MIPAASVLVWNGILGLACLVSALFAWAVLRATRGRADAKPLASWALLIAAVWLVLISLAAASGWLSRFELRPPPYLLLMVGTITLGLWAGTSRLGKLLAEGTPLVALVAAQGFRLPLELLMHRAFEEGVMPVQLSYSGFNFDILTGTGALLLAPFLYFRRAPLGLVAAWNALGFACLLVIAVVAIVTSPVLRVFGEGPSNVNYWVAYFPFVLLPAACVVFALAGHIVILRRLRLELDASQASGQHRP